MAKREFYREQLGEGFFFTDCLDPKFKVNRTCIYFVLPLKSETAASNAILSCLLSKTCRSYPTLNAFAERLNQLYGADLYSDVQKVGDYQVLSFSVENIDDCFAMEAQPITMEAVTLLCEAILDPVLEKGAFPSETFELERRFLLDSALSEQNNKRVYVIRQMMRMMFEGEPGSIEKLGSPEQICALTVKDAVEAWKNLLKTARIEVVFTGRDHPESAKEAVLSTFGKLERQPIADFSTTVHTLPKSVRRREETLPVQQGKLVIGYALGDTSANRPALRLMNTVLSVTPTSRFFMNVREKQSLCYYCASRAAASQGWLLVDCGIEVKNAAKAETAIQKEIDDLAQKGCTEQELAQAVSCLNNSFRSVPDSVSSMDWWNFSRIMTESGSLEEERQALEQVTAEEIQQLAGRLKKDCVYLLKGEEEAHG